MYTGLFLRKPSRDVRKAYDFLIRSQYWPQDQLREYQWQKVIRIIENAYKYSPFYHDRMRSVGIEPGDIKSEVDLAKIPPLEKRDLQKNLDRLKCALGVNQGVIKNSTGGSTGRPVHFYQDHNYVVWQQAAIYRAWKYFVGCKNSDLEAVLWGAVKDVGERKSYWKLVYNIYRNGVMPLNTFDLREGEIEEFFRLQNFLKPKILRGYATSLFYVAQFLNQKKINFHRPQAIISSAEVLKPQMRMSIEEAFGARVFDSYGCREVSQIATECDMHDGMHLVMENQFVEVVENQILVTNLNNFGMPFIRYQVGDLAKGINWKKCDCGRASGRLFGLVGRENDNVTINGSVVNGEFFEFLFFEFDGVKQYQVIQVDSTGKLFILVDTYASCNRVVLEKFLYNQLAEKFGYKCAKVCFTDQFLKTSSGKFRFVFSVGDETDLPPFINA